MILSWSSALWAADDSNKADQELAEVQVTGTRIQMPNVTAANPVTTITGDDLRRLGVVNVSEAMTTLVPQNISLYQPTMTGSGANGSFFIGSTIANLRGLDPAFGSRTLTMIDGRRVVSTSNQADVVDLNIIPSNLLERMDVVTGGASATYGSGAMAGVVNLVLNHRLQGINLDMDYGVTDRGDGGSKHVALSGGTTLFSGRGHLLLGGEWQDQDPIYNCATAREWCGESRTLFVNATNTFLAPGAAFTPLPGYEGMPSRFEIDNVRYSQYTPNGAILSQDVNNTSGYRFTPDGTGVEQYQFGYRGGAAGGAGVMNGDGPPTTSSTTLEPANNRKTAFSHFEFDFNDRTTGYAEASYAKTDALNVNFATQGAVCVKFNTPGTPSQPGANFPAGTVISYFVQNAAYQLLFSSSFTAFAGTNPAYFGSQTAQQAANVTWNASGGVLNQPFQAPPIPAVAPVDGRNDNAFLNTLSPQALAQVKASFNNAPSTGANTTLYGSTPCTGNTAIYKVWNPQIQQKTMQDSDTMRGVLGTKGRFGSTWNYDVSYQYGRTNSDSQQNNVWTTYRYAFAMDSVIDDRVGSATYGKPVCRVTRDGPPTMTASGSPLSDPAAFAALAAGCEPLNPFGSVYTDPAAAALQTAALNYAFQPMLSKGENSLNDLSLNTSGTLLDGWAGPITGAFGLEGRKDSVNNVGAQEPAYERADFAFGWADAFGGSTKVFEQYAEVNVPLITGVEGLNMLSIDGAVRHGQYHNQGGAGTSGESGTQNITNWKFSAVFEPFDWARFRLTRSRDLRAAGYRDLYINQPGIPDSTTTTNYWLPYNGSTTANRTDTATNNQEGNPNLKPERSDTLTLGIVLSPGGWAQGMRFSVDYSDIRVRDGIFTSFGANPIQTCWTDSGNHDPTTADPTAVNGMFDANDAACKLIHFGDPANSTNPYSNIASYDTIPTNGDPYQTRALDFSLDYLFPLNKLFENAPGSFSLTVRATRALEASGLLPLYLVSILPPGTPRPTVDYVGQLGAGLGWVPGVQPTPTWAGNIITSYLEGPFVVSLSARYVGGAKIDKTYYSDGPGQPYYQDANGNYVFGSIDNNSVPAYMDFSLNGSYDLKVSGTKQCELFATVNNLLDKDPPYSGGYLSGASPQFHDVLGRAYRMGVRLKF
ncbi:MAG TPA: TonB-dependent receptor [Steroidobacteraceae bacterium]|nr:TonB-dependent receptor [Steroidobacteraceae bacterium]